METKKINYSYSSAGGIYPMKLFMNRKALDSIINKDLSPISVNVNLTNKCNLNCSFCSCADRKKSEEINYDHLIRFFDHYKRTIQSAIITGGGEPLLYKRIQEFFDYLNNVGVKIGLVSNGLMLHEYDKKFLDTIKWARISLSEQSYNNGLFEIIKEVISKNSKNQWAFSFVACKDFEKNIEILDKYINQFYSKVTHIRIVNDLYVLDDRVTKLKNHYNTLMDKLIFQDRLNYFPGTPECYISCIKPNITATGEVMPCCGVQYAKKNSGKKDYLKEFSMGNISDPENVFDKCFDGSICDICYYMHYNNAIRNIQEKLDDVEFI